VPLEGMLITLHVSAVILQTIVLFTVTEVCIIRMKMECYILFVIKIKLSRHLDLATG